MCAGYVSITLTNPAKLNESQTNPVFQPVVSGVPFIETGTITPAHVQQPNRQPFPIAPQFPDGNGVIYPPPHMPWPGAYPIYPPNQYYPYNLNQPHFPPNYYPPYHPGHAQQHQGYIPQQGCYMQHQCCHAPHQGGYTPPQVLYCPQSGSSTLTSETINLTTDDDFQHASERSLN